MRTNHHASPHGDAEGDARPDLKEVVMGLHWDPPEDGVDAHPADLDALCMLFDAQGRMLEVVHPGHPRTADASVIHTGDSRTGSSLWDDERIFVFLQALPQAVSKLSFIVASATGRPFHEVRGAYCHISDRISENERCRLELTSLTGCISRTVATLHRGAERWRIVTDGQNA